MGNVTRVEGANRRGEDRKKGIEVTFGRKRMNGLIEQYAETKRERARARERER